MQNSSGACPQTPTMSVPTHALFFTQLPQNESASYAYYDSTLVDLSCEYHIVAGLGSYHLAGLRLPTNYVTQTSYYCIITVYHKSTQDFPPA